MAIEITPKDQDAKDAKSAKKFFCILMLIPIGLGIGVVTSNINFRKHEEAKTDIMQFRFSQIFNKADIQDDMEKIFLSQDKNTDYFLRQISSSLGINNYLTTQPSHSYQAKLGYYDIIGEDKKTITAVIIELDESNPGAKSAQIAIPTAVIKALAGEKHFSNTLRFVFLPKKYDANKRNIRQKGEKLKAQFIIRAGGSFSLDDDLDWRISDGICQHPAMAYPHESVSDHITSGQVDLSLLAAQQLKKILEAEM